MILPVRRFARAAADRPGDPCRRDRPVQVEILEADGDDLPDASGGAEHDLDELPEQPIRPRPCQYPPGLSSLNRRPNVLHLVDRERVRDGFLPVEPGDVVHRVAGQNLATDREREGEAEDYAGVLGATVAASGELLEEVGP